MMNRLLLFTVSALCALPAALALEVATGKMLGPGHDARAFYLREPGGAWRKSYSGPGFRAEAAGRMMNLRIAQAIFDDEWLSEFAFDPEKNTDRVIDALDVYRAHGVLAITVSLQGGNAGYGREFPAIPRATAAKPGPGKGMLVSAFRPDGTLKKPWMDRLLRLARALDERGMILDLAYFYQGQDEVLEGPAAIRNAVTQATDFLIDNNVRNVIIEIVNEATIRGFDHDLYIEKNLAELMRLARSRFAAKNAPFRLPVSASTAPDMRLLEAIAAEADLTMIHGNNRTPDLKRKRVAELAADPRAPGPIYMNEDDNGRATSHENLRKELASLDAVWDSGGSWGYMPWRQVQMFPFRYYLPMGEEADATYFSAVLAAIRDRVMLPLPAYNYCPVNEDFTLGRTAGRRLQDPGEFTNEGWRVGSEQTQITYDLGQFHARGTVELEVKGPLRQAPKRTLFAAWNEEAAADGDRKTQSFFQLRLQQEGMMLRLTNRAGGRSFEGRTRPLPWPDGWHTVRGVWDTSGGLNYLVVDGLIVRQGRFNASIPGFRWLFIGKDNYQKQWSVPGLVYRRIKVCVDR